MRDFTRLSVSLTCSCLAAGLLLSLVHAITLEPIARQYRNARMSAISATLPEYDNDPVTDRMILDLNGTDEEFYIAKNKGKCIGVAFETSWDGYAGPIRLMVGISPEGTVTGIRILSQQETPGLGANIEKREFTDQFIGRTLKGKSLENASRSDVWKSGNLDTLTAASISTDGILKVDKDGGEIDAITGATISSRGVTGAVNTALIEFFSRRNKILSEK